MKRNKKAENAEQILENRRSRQAQVRAHVQPWLNQGVLDVLTFTGAVGGVFVVERSFDLETWTEEPFEIIANKEISAVPLDVTPGKDAEFFRVRQVH